MVRQVAFLTLCVAVLSASTLLTAAQPAHSPTAVAAIGPSPGDLSSKPGEHPLAPLIRWGKAGVEALRRVEGYSCRLAKRERIGGKLGNYQWMSLKLRHSPFSVYGAFTNKQERPWQEVAYVEHRDGGKMFVHSDEYRLMGTVSMFPDSDRAMRDNRYPLTEAGILKLIERLVEHAENDSKFDDCEVKIYKDAKIEGRPCLYLRVTHQKRRPEFTFHMARIFIDNELNVPIRYEAYTWPDEPNGKPLLMEEYTYLDFQFNMRLTDRDFDINNPEYFFPPEFGDPEVDFRDVKPVAQIPGASGRIGGKAAGADQPLAPVVSFARDTLARVNNARDYSCLLSLRAQTGAEQGKYDNLHLKVRHKPEAMYAFFLGPKTPKGEEAICTGDHPNSSLIAHSVGVQGRPAVTRKGPAGAADPAQVAGESLNDLGIKPQLTRWLAMYEAELPRGEAIVQCYPQVEVDQRLAMCIEVTHPTQRPHFRYQRTRLFVDEGSKLPVRFEAYGWPTAAGQTPPLAEELTYRDIQLNRGFTDQDFDPANPNYAFGPLTPAVRPTGR